MYVRNVDNTAHVNTVYRRSRGPSSTVSNRQRLKCVSSVTRSVSGQSLLTNGTPTSACRKVEKTVVIESNPARQNSISSYCEKLSIIIF
jgi:hypothetical protein